MVRILLSLLILINLIYFAWNFYYPPQVIGRQPAALAKDIKRLTLLSEQKVEPRTLVKDSHVKTENQRTESPVIQRRHEAAATASETKLVTAREESPDKEASELALTERAGHEVSLEGEVGKEFATESKTTAELAEGDKVGVEGAADTAVFPEPTTEDGAGEKITVESVAGPLKNEETVGEIGKEAEISTNHTGIRIAEESADSSRAVEEDSAQPSLDSEVSVDQEQIVEVSKPPVVTRRCYTLGPFEEIMAAESLLIQIQDAGFEASRRAITEQQPARYWVYLPSAASQSAASEIAKQLANKGIKDYYVITENENMNAISLGLFSKHTGARRRFKKIQALGYQPEMEVRFRDKTIYWLDYNEMDDKKLPPQIWMSLMTEGGAVQRIVRECDIRP